MYWVAKNMVSEMVAQIVIRSKVRRRFFTKFFEEARNSFAWKNKQKLKTCYLILKVTVSKMTFLHLFCRNFRLEVLSSSITNINRARSLCMFIAPRHRSQIETSWNRHSVAESDKLLSWQTAQLKAISFFWLNARFQYHKVPQWLPSLSSTRQNEWTA